MNSNNFKILAIAGSLRRASFNRLLIAAAAECASEGSSVIIYDELDSIPMFNEDLEAAGEPLAVQRLRNAVADADGILFATPEYNHFIPGVLKNTIDWLSRARPSVLSGKPVAITGATAGAWGTRLAQASLRQVLYAAESLVMSTSAIYIRHAQTVFNAQGRLCDEETLKHLNDFMQDFTHWINRNNKNGE
jgi:chromate reductase, NAD(P)H dehydrogenase (quinone)